MPVYRATIRHGTAPQRYHVEDVEAPDLRAALRELSRRFPDDVAAGADLLEIRRQADPERREYGPE